MKKLLVLFAAVSLTGCAPLLAGLTPPPPATYADRTILDEQAASGVELAYKAARIAVETGVDGGLIVGENASRFRVLNRQAYAAVQTARAAYAAGNAQTYGAAVAEAKSLINQMLTLTGRNADD